MCVSKHVGIKDSNEVAVLATLEALRIYHFYHHYLIVKSDSVNAISWLKSLRGPWKMQFLFNESFFFFFLISEMHITFQHISRYANGMADS